jgi:hypothetical protein
MIAYYNPNSGDITTVAWDIVPWVTDPYIETDDPLILKFLSRELPTCDYKIIMADTGDSVRPQLVPKYPSQDIKSGPTFNERAALVPKCIADTDIVIEQYHDCIVIKFNETALQQWKEHPNYNDRACVIAGSATGSPYFPVWTHVFDMTTLDNLITTISYNGPADVRFFSSIAFSSISHRNAGV